MQNPQAFALAQTPRFHRRQHHAATIRRAREPRLDTMAGPTTTSIIDFNSPAAGFDRPLAMWLACHERVHRMSSLLQRLEEHIRENGVDEAAGVTANSILRYFNEAAPKHHDDEEHDLFPRLLQRLKGSERDTAERAIAQLVAEHAALGESWAALKKTLEAIERGESVALDRGDTDAFSMRYRQHIALEEAVLAPLMQQALDEASWREIGKSMAARRGVDWDELHAA
jgi:hemerythrin-like domain-containing protein